jgi:hypothetical protein
MSAERFLLWLRRVVRYQNKLARTKKKEQDKRQFKVLDLERDLPAEDLRRMEKVS